MLSLSGDGSAGLKGNSDSAKFAPNKGSE
jgi:hypothetical protein